MDSVNVKRNVLIGSVTENMKTHRVTYEEAVNDFKIAVQAITKHNQAITKRIVSGDISSVAKLKSYPSAPTNHLDEYERALSMLSMSVDDVINLDQSTFDQLVRDNWSWKRSFTAVASSYKTI